MAIIDFAGKSGGGSGSDNYNDLSNRPKINSTTLSGNKSAADLGLATPLEYDDRDDSGQSGYEVEANKYTDFGPIDGNAAFTLASSDADVPVYHWRFFYCDGVITWPSNIVWMGGNAPTLEAGHDYEVSVIFNKAVCSEFFGLQED